MKYEKEIPKMHIESDMFDLIDGTKQFPAEADLILNQMKAE
jgi:hypothetical protein